MLLLWRRWPYPGYAGNLGKSSVNSNSRLAECPSLRQQSNNQKCYVIAPFHPFHTSAADLLTLRIAADSVILLVTALPMLEGSRLVPQPPAVA